MNMISCRYDDGYDNNIPLFKKLIFLAGVIDAKSGVILAAEHAALATVGEGELAEIGNIGFGAFCSHRSLKRVKG
jgi:hypothetical protein